MCTHCLFLLCSLRDRESGKQIHKQPNKINDKEEEIESNNNSIE